MAHRAHILQNKSIHQTVKRDSRPWDSRDILGSVNGSRFGLTHLDCACCACFCGLDLIYYVHAQCAWPEDGNLPLKFTLRILYHIRYSHITSSGQFSPPTLVHNVLGIGLQRNFLSSPSLLHSPVFLLSLFSLFPFFCLFPFPPSHSFLHVLSPSFPLHPLSFLFNRFLFPSPLPPHPCFLSSGICTQG